MGRKFILELFSILKWVVIIGVIVIVGRKITDEISIDATDVTNLVNVDRSKVEETLSLTLTNKPDMVKDIYQYGKGVVTVESDPDNNIGIVYIDGLRSGLHINNRKYSMYGLKIGDATLGADNNTTYKYTNHYDILSDDQNGNPSAYIYYNTQKGDCLIIVSNDFTHKITSITYFSDMKKVTENLNSLF